MHYLIGLFFNLELKSLISILVLIFSSTIDLLSAADKASGIRPHDNGVSMTVT